MWWLSISIYKDRPLSHETSRSSYFRIVFHLLDQLGQRGVSRPFFRQRSLWTLNLKLESNNHDRHGETEEREKKN